jgi:glycosyltransferase involved in cell wall biosynthesis
MAISDLSTILQTPQVSAVMCTYGRFSCVERAINCFLAQTYPKKELIVYNTDTDSPYLDPNCDLTPYGVVIINSNRDTITKESYTNVGAIRRDALIFASGDYVVTWDDDDIFLPYFMEQAVERMQQTGLPSFKPEKSFFYAGNNLRLVKNTLEASVVASMEKVKEYGYRLETGYEGLGWYTKLRDNRELDENDPYFVPSYCFNWNDGQEMKAPHKQSGDINNPDNFQNHKKQSLDRVDGRVISIWDEKKLRETYEPYIEYFNNNVADFPPELVEKYLVPFIKR